MVITFSIQLSPDREKQEFFGQARAIGFLDFERGGLYLCHVDHKVRANLVQTALKSA